MVEIYNGFNEPQQDRVTSILAAKAATMPNNQPPPAPDYSQMYNPALMSSMAPQTGHDLSTLKQAEASGNPQAQALDKFATFHLGNDEQAKDNFKQFLIDHPNDVDPANSYQVNTAFAQWSKQSGHNAQQLSPPSPQDTSMQDLANIASNRETNYFGVQQEAAKNIAEINKLNAAAKGGTGAFGQQFALVQAAHPEWTAAEVQDYVYTRGQQQKAVTRNPDGSLALETGAKDIYGQIEGSRADAKNASDLAVAGPKARAAAEGETTGGGIAKAQLNLGSIEDSRNIVVNQVQSALNDKGKSKALGIWDANTPTMKGSDAWGFQRKVAQLNGAAFLDAYQKLRGGGAISDAEGPKATASISRMQDAATEEQFDEAARDFLHIVDIGVSRAREQAKGNLGSNTSSGVPDGAILIPGAVRNGKPVYKLPNGKGWSPD